MALNRRLFFYPHQDKLLQRLQHLPEPSVTDVYFGLDNEASILFALVCLLQS